ncbi:MAG TPA: UPF0262 family protein [Hyphomicrobiaceae bacterium]|nr:UPF0262 family protein [Hyphomicrobiaceae bacterium]
MTGPHPDVDDATPSPGTDRIVKLTLDPNSIARGNANIEHEREVAIFDILDANMFRIEGRDDGPYEVELGITEDRLVVTAVPVAGGDKSAIAVALPPLRRVMKDYFLVCENYFQAIRTAPPIRIQQIDQGRRKLHDEGASALVDRLAGKITMDNDTSRRLFTLVCALHWKG